MVMTVFGIDAVFARGKWRITYYRYLKKQATGQMRLVLPSQDPQYALPLLWLSGSTCRPQPHSTQKKYHDRPDFARFEKELKLLDYGPITMLSLKKIWMDSFLASAVP
jgi:hypothetical protein